MQPAGSLIPTARCLNSHGVREPGVGAKLTPDTLVPQRVPRAVLNALSLSPLATPGHKVWIPTQRQPTLKSVADCQRRVHRRLFGWKADGVAPHLG